MRNGNLLIVLAIAAATTGCVETMDSGYPSGSYGYSDGYNSGGYYAQPAYYGSNNYYYSPPRVVTETRYVPVPVQIPAPQHQADHRWDGNRDGNSNANAGNHSHGTPPVASNNTHTPSPPANNASNGQNNTRHRSNQDRDGDGKPDRRS